MKGFIQRDFNPLRDAAEINWFHAIAYNALRALCTSWMWLVLIGIFDTASFPQPFSFMVMHVLGYFFFGLPMVLLVRALAKWIPILTLFGMLGSLILVGGGDPIACILIRLTPLAKVWFQPPFFSPYPFLLILKGNGVIIEPDDNLILTLNGR